MSVSKMHIQSKWREYNLEFVDDIQRVLKDALKDQSFFVVDEGLYGLYRAMFDKTLPKERFFLVPASESTKTLEYAQQLIFRLLEKNLRKNSTLVAIGGGVIQDVTAFVASIIFRGIEWVFVPTTLLAQADSCIGSKTSINLGKYKNIVGNFYPPSQIWVDLSFLNSLSVDDIKSGIGEMLHYFFIAASPMAERIYEDYEKLLAQRGYLKEYALESLSIKKPVVERDEFDKKERNLFNYGHTFGHAIESITQYAVPHGQAVTLGMDLANYISLKMKMLSEKDFLFMNRILMKNMPAFEITESHLDSYLHALSKDKKNTDKNLTCILTEGPGQMKKMTIPLDDKLRQLILSYGPGRVSLAN